RHGGVTCLAICVPAETSENGPRGARNHEEVPIQRRANGQDPAGGGRGPGGRGRQEAWDQRCHDLRLAQALRQARGGGREASAPGGKRERTAEEAVGGT